MNFVLLIAFTLHYHKYLLSIKIKCIINLSKETERFLHTKKT